MDCQCPTTTTTQPTTQDTCRPPGEPENCYKQKDLSIVLDGSGSVGLNDFKTSIEFVAKLAHAFTQFRSTRLNFIVFGSRKETRVVIPLLSGLSATEIDDAIRGTIYPNGISAQTDFGIDEAIKDLYPNKIKNISQVLVVLTDGGSNDRGLTGDSAQAAAAKGITTFAAGIGGYDVNELIAISNGA